MAHSNRIKPGCVYFARCKKFFESLSINDSLFDHTYDMCYCERCHNWRGDSNTYTRGNTPKEYGIPVGWARFSLKEQPTSKAQNAADNWHRAFHGTPVSCIKPILDVGRLVAAGRNVETGMLEMCHDEEGREDWHVYLSPSISYAGYYGDPQNYMASNGLWYKIRVAMYVFIDPNSYKVKPGKIRDQNQRDPNFPDLNELEWFTEYEGGHHVYGVMVHMEQP